MAGNYLNSKRQTFVVPEELKSRQHYITHYFCQQIFAHFSFYLFYQRFSIALISPFYIVVLEDY